jgi:cytochrome c553
MSVEGRSISSLYLVALLILTPIAAKSQECESDFQGNPTRGHQIAEKQCVACHGPDGQGISVQFPSLAAQLPEYLVKQLHAFKVGSDGKSKRPSQVMAPLVIGLTDGDIADLAAYYWRLTPRAGSTRDRARFELGRRIYIEGNPSEGLPACITCHRPSGSGLRPDFPRLSGQSADYLEGQLENWMPIRGKPGKLMTMIVPLLKPNERQAVADYISQLHP